MKPFIIWLTDLSGSGKITIAEKLKLEILKNDHISIILNSL